MYKFLNLKAFTDTCVCVYVCVSEELEWSSSSQLFTEAKPVNPGSVSTDKVKLLLTHIWGDI